MLQLEESTNITAFTQKSMWVPRSIKKMSVSLNNIKQAFIQALFPRAVFPKRFSFFNSLFSSLYLSITYLFIITITIYISEVPPYGGHGRENFWNLSVLLENAFQTLFV